MKSRMEDNKLDTFVRTWTWCSERKEQFIQVQEEVERFYMVLKDEKEADGLWQEIQVDMFMVSGWKHVTVCVSECVVLLLFKLPHSFLS